MRKGTVRVPFRVGSNDFLLFSQNFRSPPACRNTFSTSWQRTFGPERGTARGKDDTQTDVGELSGGGGAGPDRRLSGCVYLPYPGWSVRQRPDRKYRAAGGTADGGGLGRRRPLSGTHSGLCRGGTGGRADPADGSGGPRPSTGGRSPWRRNCSCWRRWPSCLRRWTTRPMCWWPLSARSRWRASARSTAMPLPPHGTGNLRSGTERLYLWGKTGERDDGHRAAQYYGIIVFFIVGAALGAWCSGRWGQRAVLGARVLLLAAFLFMFQRKPLA